MNTNVNMNNHDEYTDYSCSTFNERLARDIETVLHQWHVDGGSDRHFSNHHASKAQAATMTSVNDASASLKQQSAKDDENSHLVHLLKLRSERILWNISFYYTPPTSSSKMSTTHRSHNNSNNSNDSDSKIRVNCDLELELSLWDGPPPLISVPLTSSPHKNNADDEPMEGFNLPYSLQRRAVTLPRHQQQQQQNGHKNNSSSIGNSSSNNNSKSDNDIEEDVDNVDNDWFESLATLFGIGQHITLTPVNAHCLSDTVALQPLNPSYQQLLDYLTHVTIANNITNLDEYYAHVVSNANANTSSNSFTTANSTQNSGGNGASASSSSSTNTSVGRHTNNWPSTTAILTTWLQSALNLAASHGDCQFPVFGWWGSYHGGTNSDSLSHSNSFMDRSRLSPLDMLPSWMAATTHSPASLNVIREARLRRASSQSSLSSSRHSVSSLSTPSSNTTASGSGLLSGHVWTSDNDVSAQFWCGLVPTLSSSSTTRSTSTFDWTLWGDLLRYHSNPPPSNPGLPALDESPSLVYLWKARHTYAWCKQAAQRNLLWQALGVGRTQYVYEWRTGRADNEDFANTMTTTTLRTEIGKDYSGNSIDMHVLEDDEAIATADLHSYLVQCQRFALQLVEQAAGLSSPDDPLWGPSDDPVASVQMTLTWRPTIATSPTNQTTNQGVLPLLPLPLQSRHQSEQERQEMLEATELAILDPHSPSDTVLSVRYDHSVSHATLATTLRCVLAALIRTATLPKETLLMHLMDEDVMDRWDTAAGNRIATIVSKKARVDKATRSLVTALDWKHAASDMIEPWQAEDIVLRKVLDDAAPVALGFPTPPDSIVSLLVETNVHDNMATAATADLSDDKTAKTVLWKPLFKSAPPGRLLSLLFVHMARVRSPSSMAMVWTTFVQELRRRWEARASLPNMNFVPGLDVPPHLAFGSGRGDNSRAVGNGAMAHLSAHVHSSEPDPDDFHCLIGQKLQVFNLGLESVVAAEIRHVEQLEKRPRVVNDDKATSSSSTASLLPTAAPRTLLNGAVVDGIPQVDESNATLLDRDESRSVVSETRSNLSQEFYDADEAEQFFRNMDSVPDIGLSRRGARCPVQGVFLSATGDQLYAPYLQRPFPLTDDIIAERRLVLSRQQASSSSSSSSSSTAAPLSTMPTINQRLEISQRFQRPKLHSDMRSFKAANPGATFEDFIRWYGNPSDVLADCGEMDSDSAMNELGGDELSTKSKLDRANEAIRALEQTRNFWTQTWDQALPIPAAEQEPLFDAESTVEMALDYLETIHPASLLCQVLAVNLSLSYFVLAASAGDAIHVRSVRVAIESLRATVDTALELLASDATMSIDNLQRKNSSPDMMASIEAIGACTRVCESLTAVEVIVSRAISLLRKLPQQYALVDTIMRHKEGTSVNVKVDAARSAFLHTARVQQKRVIKGNSKLKPAVREYMLRNTDDRAPCQLCVRTSDEGINVFGANQGGTVLALTKTINNGELPLPSTPVVKRQGSSGFFTI